jgi:HD-like signal output (HDOD) protein
MQKTMNQFFDQIHNVPRVPEIVRTLITQFDNPRANFDDIAKNVEKEQIIALKVLRLVNSAHFGLSKKVGTVQDAVIMLGMHQLRMLVIASGIVSSMPKIDNFDIKNFWTNSFNTSTYSKWLAAETNTPADLAFTAGLISGLGAILIRLAAPNEAREIDRQLNQHETRQSIELKEIGFTSEEICAELCRRWKFSPELINIVEYCGTPLNGNEVNKSACVVHIGRYLSECRSSKLTIETILQSFPFKVSEYLGLSKHYIVEKLPEILALESGMDGLFE